MQDVLDPAPLLQAVLNLSKFHRQHEMFYASSPLELSLRLHRHGRALQLIADQWSTATAESREGATPFEGAEDLNSPAALQLDGVLFMEGEGRPAEVSHLIRDLRDAASDCEQTGEWLGGAMQASWEMAASLVGVDGLADVLGERHRIIANDWQAAKLNSLMGRLLHRAADMLEALDLTPAAVRRDLNRERQLAARLYSCAEITGHAADLACESAGLVHDNERRWRVFRSRVGELVREQPDTS